MTERRLATLRSSNAEDRCSTSRGLRSILRQQSALNNRPECAHRLGSQAIGDRQRKLTVALCPLRELLTRA